MKRSALFLTVGAAVMLLASGAMAGQHKVDICHVPPDDPDNAHTISVSERAANQHLSRHAGDTLGPCECTDGVQNQDETDVDCGGAMCVPCGDGAGCIDSADCASGLCALGGVCVSEAGNACDPDCTAVDTGNACTYCVGTPDGCESLPTQTCTPSAACFEAICVADQGCVEIDACSDGMQCDRDTGQCVPE